jgi:Flp pilus assembly protein TadB
MNWMSSAERHEQARLDELNRKAEARAQARRCREAEARAQARRCREAEKRAKQAQQDADRKVAMLVLATAAMACMILGVCVMRASAWIGAGLLGAAALLVRWIPREGDPS